MVNRGRSRGCVTCKQRRFKCDEAKPECRACQRLELSCGGYNSLEYPKIMFKDQNHKFCNKTNQVVGSHGRDVLKPATSPSRSSKYDVQDREVARVLTSRRLSEPDTAVPFFLSHYASMGRDMGSTRGFFELLIPAYLSQGEESALSLAVSALASEILSMWRQDSSSFRSPRKSYSRAITRLRIATQDPIERGKPATVLAVLALQTYENASAIYDLRRASSMHHNGASSLLLFVNPDDMDGMVRAYLRKFMLHTEVSTAIRQKKPLKNIAYSWLGSKDTMVVAETPSSALDAIGASVAELQASYTQFVTQGGSTTSSEHTINEWRVEARRVDAELLAWAENVPAHWRPLRLKSGRDIDSSIPTYQSVCEVYPSCQIASIWNLWRFQRLLLAKIIVGSLDAFSDLGHSGFACGRFFGDPIDFANCKQTLQEMVDSMCYSIPFHLGNRTTRSSLTDFTDPTIFLPSQYSLEDGTRLVRDGLNAGLSREDHRRHVIAQGPWRAMHPLSRLLTLFSEDHGEVIATILRPGQKEWIRDQFLRVATLLHLPSDPGNNIETSKSPRMSTDAKAEYLAREIRQGAILMSGP
ncbi:uncharacterized protein N7479_005862 [Penicillium vulpinum]|uniref:Zn(2)-C6 fungal-type domain-containing protein n=1 Tax=Penicillium vulpinum TaxID=29845 RepID=A0A1V6SF18_9EURO|nr:uncharacterized protein N7479_005862 [Penicillium vulpinum]KAJ5958712.1 hypothetical protein N7479_005862 [Penicillium vulpinum]OQE12359.1 hypothetical protein PENVUL_c001G03903 [Penicillium vulpinum]